MENKRLLPRPEIWGGIECTINRVDDQYNDQLEISGHYNRPDDLDHIAGLGIKTLRYPILWEKHVKTPDDAIDWTWSAHQLNKLKSHGISIIAGLVHHGSGPVFTDLADPLFACNLADYAMQVARKFPWIDKYTIINEPLTTARFSGLYGLWFPHGESESCFLQMLINELKATVLSMIQIRIVNPAAELIQTEDLTFVHSTRETRSQACYENERRWLTYDLLCGRVDREHFFWSRLLQAGITSEELNFFIENPCPPSVMGFNYYITSERYLDEDIHRYPPHLHGGNGNLHYADTEAIQAGKQKGLKKLLKQAWDRYHVPIAVTECHIGCTPEEQVRWFMQNHQACCELLDAGVNLRAITAWSLIGSTNWNNLLTRSDGIYEAGAFEISGNRLLPTLLATMISSLTETSEFDDPLLSDEGWWNKRLIEYSS